MATRANKFVPRAKFIFNQNIQWFPRHMQKGMRDISKTLKNTDCILEVHDARIPFSGRNLKLVGRIATIKPVILLLNKSDLIDSRYKPSIHSKLLEQMDRNDVPINNIFFMDSIAGNYVTGGYTKNFISSIIESIESSQSSRHSRQSVISDQDHYNLLVVGIPNVGKSTVINRLRNVYLNQTGKATITGNKPGVTRFVLEKIKISDYPRKIYLYDSPGILEPSFQKTKSSLDKEEFMKCAICGNILDGIVPIEEVADYLLYRLNKDNNFRYVQLLGLPSPSDNITEVLTYAAIHFNFLRKIRSLETGEIKTVPALNETAEKFLEYFRKGEMGPILLDNVNIENEFC